MIRIMVIASIAAFGILQAECFVSWSKIERLQASTSTLWMGNEDGNVTLIESSGPSPTDDLSDRFKYKVHALMGDFDPVQQELDNESETGNIFGAMLNFPCTYTFTAIGKTGGNCKEQDIFVQEVVDIVGSTCGTDDLTHEVIPRGTKFTKVTVEANVESSAMIGTVYADLEKNERCTMQF